MHERILVVDDDVNLLKTIMKLLESEGYDVDGANSGEEALDKIKTEFFDLIIQDVRMPGIDGLTVVEKVREYQGNTDRRSFVLICTGFASEDAPVKALKMGAIDYILKPFEMDDFLHSIEHNMRLIRAVRDKEYFFKKLAESNKKLKTALSELDTVRGLSEKHKKLLDGDE